MEIKYYLYIKTSPLGLRYLGKTTKDPITYLGSGKIWKQHIKKHKFTISDIKTEIVFETNDVDELIKKGLELSNLYNVVESRDWANLRKESGDGGDTSKFIDFSNPVFHNPNRSKHLNIWLNEVTEEDRKKILRDRISKVDFEERDKKTKENTDWDSWRKSIKNRKTDYKFLKKIHEKNKKPVLQFDLDNNFIQEFDSASSAAKSLGYDKSGNITNCCRDRCKSTLGYRWKYKNIENIENESK
jgi:hypothetical protein